MNEFVQHFLFYTSLRWIPLLPELVSIRFVLFRLLVAVPTNSEVCSKLCMLVLHASRRSRGCSLRLVFHRSRAFSSPIQRRKESDVRTDGRPTDSRIYREKIRSRAVSSSAPLPQLGVRVKKLVSLKKWSCLFFFHALLCHKVSRTLFCFFLYGLVIH